MQSTKKQMNKMFLLQNKFFETLRDYKDPYDNPEVLNLRLESYWLLICWK